MIRETTTHSVFLKQRNQVSSVTLDAKPATTQCMKTSERVSPAEEVRIVRL